MGFFNRVKQFFTGGPTRKAGQRKRLLNSPKSRKSVKKSNKTVKRKGLALPPVKPENNSMSYSATYSPIALPESGKKVNKQKNLTKNKRNRNLKRIRGIKIGPAPPSAAPRVVVPTLARPPSPTRRRGTRKSNEARKGVPAAVANTNLINFFSRMNTVKPASSGPTISRKELESLYAAEPKAVKEVFGTAGPSEPPTFDLPTRGWTREENIKASRKYINQLAKISGPKAKNIPTNPFDNVSVNPFNQFSSDNPFNQFGPLPKNSNKRAKTALQRHFNKYKGKPISNNLQMKLAKVQQLQNALKAAKRSGYPEKDLEKIEEETNRLGEEIQV